MRRRRFDVQVLIVLLFVGGVFAAAFFIRVAENPFGLFAEPNELTLYCDDLLGLGERAELRCRGAVVGHVKAIQWGTRGTALASFSGKRNSPNQANSTEPERFWIRAGLNNRFGTWRFSRIGHIRGAVMQSTVTPSWIELVPATPAEPAPTNNSVAEIQLVPDKEQPGAEGMIAKASQIGDGILDIMHAINPPRPDNPEAAATPPIEKIVTVIDDLSKATHSLREFAVRLDQKGSDQELTKALQDLKTAVAQLHEHVTEADGAVQETRDAMVQFKKAAKTTDASAAKFSDLVDRFGDTAIGRAFVRKKSPTPTPTPRH